MDLRRMKIEPNAVTRNLSELDASTGNIYETVVLLSKRANQIGNSVREELHQKINEFASSTDSLEEVFENREQIELAKFYEHLPKPTLISINEFLNGRVYYKNPNKELGDF